MAPFDLPAIAALLISTLLMVLLLARRRRAAAESGSAPEKESLDTVQSWPPQAVRVMTLPERLAFGTLRRALPRHLVLAQVPLSRFIKVPPGKSYKQWMARVGRLNVDLLVCDSSSRVIAAIEVRSADPTPRSVERHERSAQVLQAAGIQVHVWSETHLPTIAEVRGLFTAKGDASALTASDTDALDDIDIDGRKILPVPEIQELLMQGDGLDYQLNEPVPSGFFDDLDASSAARRAHV